MEELNNPFKLKMPWIFAGVFAVIAPWFAYMFNTLPQFIYYLLTPGPFLASTIHIPTLIIQIVYGFLIGWLIEYLIDRR
jgi:uncharacterized membrane protein